jgi:mediator of RNA polymerase II transcription subunit 18
MYELSLLAIVAEKDVPRACNVLSGLCAQEPWESIHHVHFFRGPGRPSGMSNPSPTPTQQQKDIPALWKELDQALSRQSYHMQVRYEVSRGDFGSGNMVDFNAAPGILRWTDFPEPPAVVASQEKGLITQRKKIEIWGQKNLYNVLMGKQYR